MSISDNFLNEVDITSKIRSKGEYKYYYCGENNSETDKSFLAVSSMWFNEKVSSDMEIISSCHNIVNTAQIFLNNKLNKYNIFIYKNIIDYRNENMKLKLLYRINLSSNLNVETNNNTITIDKRKLKVFLVGKNYLIINIIDFNILLLDYTTGNFITIFARTFEDKETLFNVIDTYDEPYMVDGEQKIRSYVFLSKKNQERKTPTYSYKYFIIQKDVFKLKNILLHSIDFDLGNAEPLGLKIGKIFMPDSNLMKFCFIFIFISSSTLFQLITDYDNINLHNMLKKNSRAENSNKENEEEENNVNNINNNDKLNSDRDKENNNNNLDKDKDINKINIDNNDLIINKTKYWTIKRKIESEKKNFVQSIKSCLNINDKRICSFVLFFESKNIISYSFNYTDSPEEIRDKIFVTSNINLSSEPNNFVKYFKSPAKVYKYVDLYMFKNGSFFNYSRNNLILCDKSKMHIYSDESDLPIYTYEFYQEDLSCFITIEGIGSTFLLTGNKLFKIIFNQRYNLFSDEKILKNNKVEINYFKANKKLSYPVFEFQPENIWNSYCVSLGLEKIDFKEGEEIINNNEENIDINNNINNINNKEEKRVSKINKRINSKYVNNDKYCSLCGKKSDKSCSDCNIRFYCCEEHFKYDFYSYHFFECQWIQFFSRKDIMTIKDKEIRYKILYNELIKVCGRILTFIFMRIYCKNDYQYFLNMILINIRILENFGFKMNLSEFCNCNYTLNERIINRFQKIIFYQEALFFYVQLNFLKCTFTLKSNLYNLTDCYLKIINSDIIPLLTPKMNKRLISLKCDKINIDILYNNQYFNEFNSELFFDIEKFIKNNSAPNNLIDLVEEYITKHIFSLSLLVKFKSKINSSIEVQNAFVNINLMFDDHFTETEKKIAAYCYFFISFYLVEIGKIPQTIKLLKRMVSFFAKLDNDINILKYLTYYNLGVLQYAIGSFDIGIHNIETAYKLIVENNFSDKIKLKVIDSLGLAYLNRRNLYKAFLLIKKSIQERKKLNKKNDEIDCTKLNVYLNYINDLYEYTFISKARLLIKKKNKNSDKMKLMKFVLGEEDKELVISEQNISDVIKVAKFIWDLPEDVLKQLNIDNPPKNLNVNNNREEHHDKNISFNSEITSNLTTTFMYKENLEKEEAEEDYEDDIEIKTSLYEFSLTREQKQIFGELKTTFLKRDIILRDSLGDIEKFNINYEPIFAIEFEKIIEKLKSSFLLKEIFYCFQNEKWRDELYNYNQNNILFGLSKYLKMEKIKNMLAIEKTKIMEALKQKKLMRKNKNNNNIIINDNKNNMLIDYKNQVAVNEIDNYYMEKSNENEIEISNDISSKSSSSLISKEKEEKNIGIQYNNKIQYKQFKANFIAALKDLEKDKRNQDLYEFLDFDENYLYNLYVNVFKNNPDSEFIFQNPLLILNYIFIEINKVPEVEIKKVDLEPEILLPKEEEKKSKSDKSEQIKEIEEEKKENEENEEKEEKKKFNSSYSSNNNEENSISNEEMENKSNEEENKKDENKEKEKEKDNDKDKEKEENKDIEEESIKYELNRKNSLMEKFEREENIYDYIRDEINISTEISLEYIMKNEEIIQSKRQTIKSLPTQKENKRTSIIPKHRKSEVKNIFFLPFFQDKKQLDHHKTLIQEADKYLLTSKENSKNQENEKTFQIIQKHNRQSSQIDVPKLNINEIKNKKEEEKNDSNSNAIKNKPINYMPFINKTKKSLKKSSNKSEKEEKAENEEYFDLKKEMALNDIKTKKKKRREHNFSVNIYEKGNSKLKSKKNKYEISDSFEKILNNKNQNKNKSVLEYKSKSKSKNKTKGKNVSFKFKNKEEREKELEAGALLFLKNENNFKKKNMMKNVNNSVLNGKPNRNKNNIIVKKRIFKSTDEKRVNIYNKKEIEISDKKNLYIKPNYKNRNKKKSRLSGIKINSTSTLKSTSIECDDIRAKKSPKKNINKVIKKNKSPSKNKKTNKKGKSNIFEEEYKKIIEFNKRKNIMNQIKLGENENLRINLDNNYQNDMKNIYSDIQNRAGKNILYNATSPSGNEEFIKYNNKPKTGDRKIFVNNYYKKSNFIPTTNCTNTESPANTRLITFQGKGNINNNIRAWSKGKSKDN